MAEMITFHEHGSGGAGSTLSGYVPEHSGHLTPGHDFSSQILDISESPGHSLIKTSKLQYEVTGVGMYQALLVGSEGKKDPMPQSCPCGGEPIPFKLVGKSKVKVNGVYVSFMNQSVDWGGGHGTGKVTSGKGKIRSDSIT